MNLTLLHTSDIHSRLLPYDLVITQADADLGLGALNSVANVGGSSAQLVAFERGERLPFAFEQNKHLPQGFAKRLGRGHGRVLNR